MLNHLFMRVISLVPSWTETLIEAGVEVVGRTRYCIHPRAAAHHIPMVGGTKDIRWDRVKEIKADILLLDKEENPKIFAEQSPLPVLSTHVSDLTSMSSELRSLGQRFKNSKLEQWAREAQELRLGSLDLHRERFPGLLEWWRPPGQPIQKVIYVIWEKPWMVVGEKTFIASVFNSLGVPVGQGFGEKYPKIQLESVLTSDTLVLFSSEPFPFAKHRQRLMALAASPMGLVDGESFSWFGVRALKFLRQF